MIIDGQKWSCDACVRGHRVTTCKHHDRPLTRINRKGRPFSTCSICHCTPCPLPEEHGKLKREAESHAASHHHYHSSKRASGSHSRYSRPFTGFLPIAPRPVAAKATKAQSWPVSISSSPSSTPPYPYPYPYPCPGGVIPDRPESKPARGTTTTTATANSESESESETTKPRSFDLVDPPIFPVPVPTTAAAPVSEEPVAIPFSLPALSESIPSTSTSSSLSSSSDIMPIPPLDLPVDLEMEMELPLPMVEDPWGPQSQSQEPSGSGLGLDLDLMGELGSEADINAFCDVSDLPVPGAGVLPKRDEDLSMQFWVPAEGF